MVAVVAGVAVAVAVAVAACPILKRILQTHLGFAGIEFVVLS